MPTFNDDLRWRYATKKYDTTKKVSEADFADLLESLRLSPSSYGLQPWKFLVIQNPAVRAKLKPVAWDQAQVTDASHFIVLCAKKNLNADDIHAYIDFIARERGVPAESLQGFRSMLLSSIDARSEEEKLVWAQKQCYIALGIVLAACAQKQIDSTPMEGFDKAQFDEILDLAKDGLTSTVACAIGYRAKDDTHATDKKVRFPTERVVEVR